MTDDDGSLNVHLGDVIAGKYRIERVLGRGAMGIVVAAMHLELGEMRAIKFMSADALDEPGAAERFLREARAAARLKSQHVTRVHDVGHLTTAAGKSAPYIVMEYLEGTDLRARLRKDGPLSVDEAVLFVVQACEAVGEAHEAGIVHRDLKPGNLFLTTGVGGAPTIKVFDFGVAKLLQPGSASDARELTATAALLGTPKFMSPEQMRADRKGVDARSDIWALGVTLHNLLTRQAPFEGDSIGALCSSILWTEPARASAQRPGIPHGLDEVILRCIAKDPAGRYQTAAALAEALLPFGSDEVRRAAPRVRATVAAPSTTSGTHPVATATTTPGHLPSVDGPLASATGAPWAHATSNGVRPRTSWSGARIGGVVGLGVVAVAAGVLGLLQVRASAPAPAVRAPAGETLAPVPAAITQATATATAAPSATPAVAEPVATVMVAAGAPRASASTTPPPERPRAPRDPAGKGARPSADPFWSSRR